MHGRGADDGQKAADGALLACGEISYYGSCAGVVGVAVTNGIGGMKIIGIDPGISGAIAFIDSDGLIGVYDMPVMPKGKRKQVNAAAVAGIIAYASGPVYLERVSAMPKQGVSSTFTFGEAFGVIRGATAALGLPIQLVTPQQWKRRFSLLGADKDAARTKAIELYPEASLSRKKDVGRADALLIARYGMELERHRAAA